MSRPFRSIPLALASALALGVALQPAAQAAPPEGKGKPHKHQHQYQDGRAEVGLDVLIRAGIGAGDARALAMQHGLTGYGELPPGIRKNLARGKPLPPGIAKKVGSPAFIRDLPRYDGYEWRMAGNDLVLVSIASQVIADILVDIFR